MPKQKNCLICGYTLGGRKDARTCSARCRKRLQRQRQLLALEFLSFQETRASTEPELSFLQTPVSTDKKPLFSKLKIVFLAGFLVFMGLQFSNILALTQGYITYDSDLKQGMIVSLDPSSSPNSRVVQRATTKNLAKITGVAVGINDSLLTVANAKDNVYVADSGAVSAYVSDINGGVKKGDLLSLSPLAGILMKNTDSTQGVIGMALADFPSSYDLITPLGSDGKQIKAKLALMSVNVNIYAPTAKGANVLANVGKAVTGKSISPGRVAAAGSVFVILLVIEGAIVYSTISNGMVAVGRNPLASKLVTSQVIRSFKLIGAFLLVGGSVIVIILWL